MTVDGMMVIGTVSPFLRFNPIDDEYRAPGRLLRCGADVLLPSRSIACHLSRKTVSLSEIRQLRIDVHICGRRHRELNYDC